MGTDEDAGVDDGVDGAGDDADLFEGGAHKAGDPFAAAALAGAALAGACLAAAALAGAALVGAGVGAADDLAGARAALSGAALVGALVGAAAALVGAALGALTLGGGFDGGAFFDTVGGGPFGAGGPLACPPHRWDVVKRAPQSPWMP